MPYAGRFTGGWRIIDKAMKKIMFNDRYGLTKAVLEGRKTMTRRLMAVQPKASEDARPGLMTDIIYQGPTRYHWAYQRVVDQDGGQGLDIQVDEVFFTPPFEANTIVAVSQRYSELVMTDPEMEAMLIGKLHLEDAPGWSNKMYVAADLMPHRIRMNSWRVERLQDISDEDCLREGVDEFVLRKGDGTRRTKYSFRGADNNYLSPRDAFAALIDKISGKGTWEKNPWVFVYEFELVK